MEKQQKMSGQNNAPSVLGDVVKAEISQQASKKLQILEKFYKIYKGVFTNEVKENTTRTELCKHRIAS